MNLQNKNVTIESLSVNSYPPESTVKVAVSEELLPGVFKNLGTYTLKFEMVFNSFNDPNLLAVVADMLEQLPD
jgi:hypothetical protein